MYNLLVQPEISSIVPSDGRYFVPQVRFCKFASTFTAQVIPVLTTLFAAGQNYFQLIKHLEQACDMLIVCCLLSSESCLIYFVIYTIKAISEWIIGNSREPVTYLW